MASFLRQSSSKFHTTCANVSTCQLKKNFENRLTTRKMRHKFVHHVVFACQNLRISWNKRRFSLLQLMGNIDDQSLWGHPAILLCFVCAARGGVCINKPKKRKKGGFNFRKLKRLSKPLLSLFENFFFTCMRLNCLSLFLSQNRFEEKWLVYPY